MQLIRKRGQVNHRPMTREDRTTVLEECCHMSVTLAKYFVSKWKLLCFTVLALAFCASNSWAQAPSIVFDAQQTVGFSYSNPQAIAVSSNGTVFIADTGNNRIIALDTFLPQNG